MTIKLDSLEIKTKLPELPASVPVHALLVPSMDERRTAMGRLGEQLKLGTLRAVELDHGVVLASERGDITCFHASGAVWARDATVAKGATNEFRKWEGQTTESTPDGARMVLNADAAKKLIGQARELLQPLGLPGREVASSTVQLDQVAQLDAKGKQVARGAGPGVVKFQYAVDNVPVRGAGAKTLAFVEPEDGAARFAGVFHAWRPLGKDSTVKLPPVEAALAVGLLGDPELDRHAAAGHRIQITRLEFVYLALPAFMRQTHLFPAFQVEGFVSEGKLGIGFHFGRFHHAAPPKAYANAQLYGSYLSSNPDGITPLRARQAVA
jgi:hypothetical protein